MDIYNASNKTKYINHCKINNLNPDLLETQLDYFWQDFTSGAYYDDFIKTAEKDTTESAWNVVNNKIRMY